MDKSRQPQLQLQSQLITLEEQNCGRAADAVKEIHRGYRYMLYIGFFLNAPALNYFVENISMEEE